MTLLSQKNRIAEAEEHLNAVYEEVLNGYVDDDCMQIAVDCQITINRLVWKLNNVYYGTDTAAYEDKLYDRLSKARGKGGTRERRAR